MKISTNQPAKTTITKGATFTRKAISKGPAFSKKTLESGSNAWEGENLSGGDPALDFLESGGVAPGLGEAGGIAHFKNRSKVTITH